MVYNSNPAAVAPHQNRVVSGLAREDLFTAVLDQFQTDTADYADILLPVGMSKLESAAPAHVAYVRHLVVDNLSGERLRRLGQDAERILQRIDSPAC